MNIFYKGKKNLCFLFCMYFFLVIGCRRLWNRIRKDLFINRSFINVSIVNVWLYYEKNEYNEI